MRYHLEWLKDTVNKHEQVTSRIWEVCFTIADCEVKLCLCTVKSSKVSLNSTFQCACVSNSTTPSIIRLNSHVIGEYADSIFDPDCCSDTLLLNSNNFTVSEGLCISVGINLCVDSWKLLPTSILPIELAGLDNSEISPPTPTGMRVSDKQSMNAILRVTWVKVQTVDILSYRCTETRIFLNGAL